ncbi:MAG: hypothetical protein BYD32DRAFT_438591 [Podila humilis]|nr:MAG: hypothetical protein BYD32DRAFT_438591 [Podila humilis]
MTGPSPPTSSDPISFSQKGRRKRFIVSEDEEEVEEVEEVEEEDDQSNEDYVSLPDEDGSQEEQDIESMPESITIRLNFRRGQPSSESENNTKLRRIKSWPPQTFVHGTSDGYNVFLARITDFIDQIRAKKEFRGIQWWSTATPYIKPTHTSRQDKYSPLTPDDFQQRISRAWRSEMSHKKNSSDTTPVEVDIFAYLKDTAGKDAQTILRQSRSRIEEANRRLNEARIAGTMPIGPVTQTIYSRELASQVRDQSDEPIPPPPHNPLYTQSRRLDERLAERQQQQQQQQQAATSEGSRDMISVRVVLSGDHWVQVDMTEIRKALGFDLIRLGETTRDPTPPPVERPATDVVDIQH